MTLRPIINYVQIIAACKTRLVVLKHYIFKYLYIMRRMPKFKQYAAEKKHLQ